MSENSEACTVLNCVSNTNASWCRGEKANLRRRKKWTRTSEPTSSTANTSKLVTAVAPISPLHTDNIPRSAIVPVRICTPGRRTARRIRCTRPASSTRSGIEAASPVQPNDPIDWPVGSCCLLKLLRSASVTEEYELEPPMCGDTSRCKPRPRFVRKYRSWVCASWTKRA